MTHTLNRLGLTEDRPGEETVLLCMVHRAEKAGKTDRMREMVSTVLKYRPDNIMGAPFGLEDEAIVEMGARAGIITAVFSDQRDVTRLVEEIREKRLGISVVLSALFSDVRKICRCTGLREHTFNVSLGVFGRKEQLPDERTLEITTQCGHALVSPGYVRHVVRKIKSGKMTPAEGARLLAGPCVCGIVNPRRTEKLLDEMARR